MITNQLPYFKGRKSVRSVNGLLFGKQVIKYLNGLHKSLIAIRRDLPEWRGEDADIDYLKIDIKWAEWHVLPQILQSGMMGKERQLAAVIQLTLVTSYFGEDLGLNHAVLASFPDPSFCRQQMQHFIFQRDIVSLNFTDPNGFQDRLVR